MDKLFFFFWGEGQTTSRREISPVKFRVAAESWNPPWRSQPGAGEITLEV